MFQLNTFLFLLLSKEKIILFTKHMWIQSRSSNKNKKSFSRSILLSHSSIIRKILFNQVWIFSFGIRTLLLHFYLLFFISFLPSFLNSHKVWSCRIWPISSLSEKYEKNQIDFPTKSTMWNPRFFPLSLSLSRRYSVWINREPFLLYLYESILLHSKIPSRYLLRNRIGSQIDGLVWAYPCGYAPFE